MKLICINKRRHKRKKNKKSMNVTCFYFDLAFTTFSCYFIHSLTCFFRFFFVSSFIDTNQFYNFYNCIVFNSAMFKNFYVVFAFSGNHLFCLQLGTKYIDRSLKHHNTIVKKDVKKRMSISMRKRSK